MSTSSADYPGAVQVNHVSLNGNNGEIPHLDRLNQLAQRVQELVEQVDAMPDLAARALLQDCLQSVLALHAQGLSQMLQIVQGAPGGKDAWEQLVQDDVVRGLLLIHGLHPISLEVRLQEALKKLRPYMESHGGNVELISLENDFARLQLQGACKGCPSSSVTMELAVRRALEEACPDLMGFEVEGVMAAPASTRPGVGAKSYSSVVWTTLDGLDELSNGSATLVHAEKVPLVICKVNDHFYAYANMCPACGLPFDVDGFKDALLGCPMGHLYDPQLAGKSVDTGDCHLHPFPLIVENGQVKVSVR